MILRASTSVIPSPTFAMRLPGGGSLNAEGVAPPPDAQATSAGNEKAARATEKRLRCIVLRLGVRNR
jgi:hypothetical protein